jgi:opacity protein-like surface antigen
MIKLMVAVSAAALLSAVALAQTDKDIAARPDSSESQQNAPGTGGMSKPGVPGEPGTKSGTTVAPDDKDRQSGTSQSNAIQQDQSKVPGMKGNKSGEAPK